MLGAIGGALMAHLLGAQALWLVSVFAMALAIVALFIPRPLQRRFNQKIAAPQPHPVRAR
ncbi:hypothetical protein D3C87_2084710 [compost metagenome]